MANSIHVYREENGWVPGTFGWSVYCHHGYPCAEYRDEYAGICASEYGYGSCGCAYCSQSPGPCVWQWFQCETPWANDWDPAIRFALGHARTHGSGR